MARIKAVIFDLDGVLVDAKEWHYEALNRALGLFGYRITRFEHLRRYDGLPTRSKLKMLTQDKGLPESLHEFINRMKQKQLLEVARRRCRPNPTHLDALARLKQDGLELAMASNSIRRTVDFLTERTGVAKLLTFRLSNEDVEHPKPHPEIYRKAMQRLGVPPQECVAVEDGAYGIEAAKQAGCRVFEVKHVDDVNYAALRRFLHEIETGATVARAA